MLALNREKMGYCLNFHGLQITHLKHVGKVAFINVTESILVVMLDNKEFGFPLVLPPDKEVLVSSDDMEGYFVITLAKLSGSDYLHPVPNLKDKGSLQLKIACLIVNSD